MVILLTIAVFPLILLGLFSLEDELHAFRLARKRLFYLEWLQQYTGIFRRSEVERLIGKQAGPDKLYELSPEDIRVLPRNRWVCGPHHFLLDAVCLAGLIFSVGWSWAAGVPFWGGLIVFGGYFVVTLAWASAWLFFKVRFEDEDWSRQKDANVGSGPIGDHHEDERISSERLLADWCAIREAILTEEEQLVGDRSISPLQRWLPMLFYRRLNHKVIRSIRELEDIRASWFVKRSELRQLLVQIRWDIADLERVSKTSGLDEQVGSRLGVPLDQLRRMEPNVEQIIRDMENMAAEHGLAP